MLKRVLYVAAILAIVALPALAQEQQERILTNVERSTNGLLALAIGIGISVAAFGGALGQGGAIGKAVESVARQPEAGPRIQTMMIIGLVLIESLVIYALVICFVLMGQFIPLTTKLAG